ncbi:MAG: PorT family protein [Paludibacteraceae bacterium]|nr:PorT family protein [Paludibacteraceae bacterium]
MVKRFISCAVALSTLSSFAQAEETPAKKVTVDAHVGMNLSSYLWNNTNLRPGLLAGVGVSIGNKCFSFNPELNYSMIGANDVVSNDWEALKRIDVEICPVATETLHYLEVPLYFKWTFGSGDVRPVVAVAPTFAFGLGGTRNYVTEDFFMAGDVHNKTPLFKADKSSGFDEARYNRFDFSGKFKAGVVVKNHYEVLAGLRWGITSLQKDAFELHFSDCIVSNPSWNLFMTFGYRF